MNPNFTGNLILGEPNRHFNPDAFITPLAGTWGSAPSNCLNGPGLATRIVAGEEFPIRERSALHLRVDMFNVFNHTNFNTPNPLVFTPGATDPTQPVPSVPAATAGIVISTATTSRQIQFGIRLGF